MSRKNDVLRSAIHRVGRGPLFFGPRRELSGTGWGERQGRFQVVKGGVGISGTATTGLAKAAPGKTSIGIGFTGPAVKTLRNRLALLGWCRPMEIGQSDQFFDENLAYSVKEYAQSKDTTVPPDGSVNEVLWSMINQDSYLAGQRGKQIAAEFLTYLKPVEKTVAPQKPVAQPGAGSIPSSSTKPGVPAPDKEKEEPGVLDKVTSTVKDQLAKLQAFLTGITREQADVAKALEEGAKAAGLVSPSSLPATGAPSSQQKESWIPSPKQEEPAAPPAEGSMTDMALQYLPYVLVVGGAVWYYTQQGKEQRKGRKR